MLSADDAPNEAPALPERAPPLGQPRPIDPSPPFTAT